MQPIHKVEGEWTAPIPYHTIPYHGCATVDATSGYAWL